MTQQPSTFSGARRWRSVLSHLERELDRRVLDRRYGFPPEASGVVYLDELGLAAPGRNSYSASSWGQLRRIIPAAEVSNDDVFLDLGCGMGRVLLQAARHPYSRVIGVDIAPQFTEIARQILERNTHRLGCRDVRVETADAATYQIPDDVTVVYAANPVTGDLFDAMLNNIFASVDRRPRTVRLVYFEPTETGRLLLDDRVRFVRHWRRGLLRRWEPHDFVSLFEIMPA